MMFFVLAATASATRPSAFLHLAPEKVAFKEASSAKNPIVLRESRAAEKSKESVEKLREADKLHQEITTLRAKADESKKETSKHLQLLQLARTQMAAIPASGKDKESAAKAEADLKIQI